MRFYVVKKVLLIASMFCIFGDVFAHAQTHEEKELLEKAREHRFRNMSGVVRTIKSSWSVIEWMHQGVSYNSSINEELTDCWRRAYSINDSSRSLKITRQDMMDVFQCNLKKINPNLSFSQKSAALRAMYSDAHDFVRHHIQSEFRETIQKAQRLILKNIKPYIPASANREFAGDTERVFKDGMCFLILVLLNKQKKNLDSNDERFVRAKVDMFIRETSRQYPYVSAAQFESWAFSLLNDLFFGECVVCMDARSELFMSCCKTKSLCRGCYARIHTCPLCRAPKPTY